LNSQVFNAPLVESQYSPSACCGVIHWIKQHLKIQVFWGYSFNAVKTQICIAIATFLLVAIIKKQLKIKPDLYEILQILQVSQFEKTALQTLISEAKLQISENSLQKELDLVYF